MKKVFKSLIEGVEIKQIKGSARFKSLLYLHYRDMR